MPFRQLPLAVTRARITNARRLAVLAVFLVANVALRFGAFRPEPWLFGLFVVALIAGGVYHLILRRTRSARTGDRVQTIGFVGDITVLTAMLLTAGGGWWLGAALHAFIVTFAYAGLPAARARWVTAYAVVAYVALLAAQATGVVTPRPLFDMPSLAGRTQFATALAVLGGTGLVAFAVTQHTFVRIMRRSQERYRLLVQTAPDLILSLDTAGVVVGMNEAAQVFAASRGEDLHGRPIAMVAHPDDRDAIATHIRSALDGDSRQQEFRLLGAHGEEQWFLCSFNALREEDNRATGVLLVARDITRRRRNEEQLRRSEEQLRQSQKMEAVGRLAGGIAHDFNNLLTVISAYSEFLMRGIKDGTPRHQDVEGIYNASLRAAALTNQLLAFSRKQVMQPRVLDMNDVVSGMLQMLGRLIESRVRVETSLYPELSPLRADPTQLEQVILNLVVNARDAMPEGGVVRIETDDVFLDTDYVSQHRGAQPGRHVMLCIRDTGTGMDDETLRRAFEPFFTTKPQGEGTGLGLATVYGIVEQSGGHMTVQSEVGRGTTFRIYLPAAEEGAVIHVSPVGTDIVPTGSETILLVEDSDALRDIVVRILEDFGYTVLVAPDGEEGLRVAEEYAGEIDLLLTDVVMPQMGGRELALTLWQTRPDMRVLFTSGYNEDSILRQGLRKPTVAFLAKPFRPEALARKVREVIDRAHVPTPVEPAPPVPSLPTASRDGSHVG